MDKSIRNFFEPDWRKFVIPVILILSFFYMLDFFYAVGSIGDAYVCEYFTRIADLNDAGFDNNTKAFDILNDIWLAEDRFVEELAKEKRVNLYLKLPVYLTLWIIDPILPEPCTLTGFDNARGCTDYIDQETFDCVKSAEDRIKNNPGDIYSDGFVQVPTSRKCFEENDFNDIGCFNYTAIHLEIVREYKPLTNTQIAGNVILLFIEGYLVSCLLLHTYHWIRKRKR